MKRLSKSKILSGRQCEKRLWLEVHQPELSATSADTEHRFAVGNQVNDVARSLHGGGHLIEWGDGPNNACAETKRMLNESPDTTLFEATFAHKGVLVRVDILKKAANGYRLIEVKSSASVKDPNYPDCAVQAWVLQGCGLPIERVELAHIDTSFVYNGDGDYRGLFHHEDLTEAVAELQPEVPGWVARFQEVLSGDEPEIATGGHCHTPYSCPFINHCAGAQPEYPVTCLPYSRGVAEQLLAEGIDDIRDIPLGRLNRQHERVRRVTIAGKAELNPAVRKKLAAHSCPRFYLDFETTQFAVPIWKDTSPYKILPFQWSCHIEAAPGKFEHKEFIDTGGGAPMLPFIESLLRALGDSGSIFVYSPFEKTRLNQLAAWFPTLQPAIEKVIARLVDLCPLAKKHYYHPDMRGSWSLKAVLPTIAPQLDYGDLGEVQDGGAAERAYQEIIHPDTEPSRAQALTADLLEYCKRDTEALIALVQFLSTGKPPRIIK